MGDLSNVCSQKCSEMLVLGKYWTTGYSMVSEQTCTIDHTMDQSLWQTFISFDLLHSSKKCEYKQYCYVGVILPRQWRSGLFQDSDFAGDLEDFKSTSGGTLCIFGSHTFLPISWMCKKQTSLSHSSTESEIISLDAGLRLDGVLALDFWDLIVSVLGNMIQTTERLVRPVKFDKSQRSQGKTNVLNDIDRVPSNVQFSHQEALLYVFEDNEAVIKMIIKGRSPTMRHVSRPQSRAWSVIRSN